MENLRRKGELYTSISFLSFIFFFVLKLKLSYTVQCLYRVDRLIESFPSLSQIDQVTGQWTNYGIGIENKVTGNRVIGHRVTSKKVTG